MFFFWIFSLNCLHSPAFYPSKAFDVKLWCWVWQLLVVKFSTRTHREMGYKWYLLKCNALKEDFWANNFLNFMHGMNWKPWEINNFGLQKALQPFMKKTNLKSKKNLTWKSFFYQMTTWKFQILTLDYNTNFIHP